MKKKEKVGQLFGNRAMGLLACSVFLIFLGASSVMAALPNASIEYQPMSGPFENLHVQLFYSGVNFPDNPPGQESQPQWHGVITYLVPLL